jgi:chromosome segregation ATPase
MVRQIRADIERERAKLDAEEQAYAEARAKHAEEERAAMEKNKEDDDKELTELDEELDDIEMGLGFRPSQALVKLRSEEAGLARIGSFEQSARARDEADAKEMEERRAFDEQQRKKHTAKLKTTQEAIDARREELTQNWTKKGALLEEKFRRKKAEIEKEISAYEKRIASLTKGGALVDDSNESPDVAEDVAPQEEPGEEPGEEEEDDPPE